MTFNKEEWAIRQLRKNEETPFGLLLLADETVEAINKYISDSEIYVFEKDEKIIALYVLKVLDNERIEIKNIAVEDSFQGKGIGSLLLRDASERATKRGFKFLFIGTGDASIKQLYLYQKEGFEMSKIIKNFFIDNYPAPIYENGLQLKHMIVLQKSL